MEHDPILRFKVPSLNVERDVYGKDEIDLDLPLRADILKNRNFLELNDRLDSESHNDQKVRFDIDSPKDDTALTLNSRMLSHIEKRNKSDSEINSQGRTKESVEELLQHAVEVNDFVAENINNMKTYPTNSNLSNRNLQRVLSSGNPRTESLSTFDLSDNELEDPYDLDIPTSVSASQTNLERSKSPLDEVTTVGEIEHILYGEGGEGGNFNSPYNFNENGTDQETPELEREVFDFDKDTCLKNVFNYLNNKGPDHNLDEDSLNEHDESEFVELDGEGSINNLKETIRLIKIITERQDIEDYDVDEINHVQFANFIMKNTPSLSYDDFIDRIQSKCLFGSIVYQSATYLVQKLFLKRDKPDERFKLKHKIDDNEIHRIIIASIRIATKLIEDHVHSHHYFCKVTGISKRLLTKLEVSILLCVKDEDLVITRKKLIKSIKVLDELRTY